MIQPGTICEATEPFRLSPGLFRSPSFKGTEGYISTWQQAPK